MAFDTIDYSAGDGIARIVLNRPERLNAINRGLISDLRDAIIAANEDGAVRVMVLSGARVLRRVRSRLGHTSGGCDARRDGRELGPGARLRGNVAQRPVVHVALGEPKAGDRADTRLVRGRWHGHGALRGPDLHGRRRPDQLSAGAGVGRADV